MTVGERIKTLSQDWFLTEPLLFAVITSWHCASRPRWCALSSSTLTNVSHTTHGAT